MSKAGITSFSSLTTWPHSISESSGDWNHVRSPTKKASMVLVQLTEVETEVPTIVGSPALIGIPINERQQLEPHRIRRRTDLKRPLTSQSGQTSGSSTPRCWSSGSTITASAGAGHAKITASTAMDPHGLDGSPTLIGRKRPSPMNMRTTDSSRSSSCSFTAANGIPRWLGSLLSHPSADEPAHAQPRRGNQTHGDGFGNRGGGESDGE